MVSSLRLHPEAGYNPELGGSDSSYNAKGMVFVSRHYTIVADKEMKGALFKMLDRAAKWEASRVYADGRINTEGNTRVGGKKTEKGRLGARKKAGYAKYMRHFIIGLSSPVIPPTKSW